MSMFAVPCPVCGAEDEHEAWRTGTGARPGYQYAATFCPHPAEPGHGTGCCCAGRASVLRSLADVILDQETGLAEGRYVKAGDGLIVATGHVSVPAAALDALIEYANGKRDQSDSQFLAGAAEYDRSQREFDDLIAALELPGRASGHI